MYGYMTLCIVNRDHVQPIFSARSSHCLHQLSTNVTQSVRHSIFFFFFSFFVFRFSLFFFFFFFFPPFTDKKIWIYRENKMAMEKFQSFEGTSETKLYTDSMIRIAFSYMRMYLCTRM